MNDNLESKFEMVRRMKAWEEIQQLLGEGGEPADRGLRMAVNELGRMTTDSMSMLQESSHRNFIHIEDELKNNFERLENLVEIMKDIDKRVRKIEERLA